MGVGQRLRAVDRGARDQRRVLAEERHERERVVGLVGDAEREHGAVRGERGDRGLQRPGVVADGLDHDVGLGVLGPRGRVVAHDLVDAERGRHVGAVDAVDAGHPRRAARLHRVAEEQADRSLPDHRHALARDVGDAVELVQHRAQRLHDGRLDVGERRRSA